MGCIHSHVDASRPNLFQRNLCLHNKFPASDIYTVVSELGKGAFGVVEKVEHKKTKKHYAMKTVTFAKGSERSAFEKEMDILRGLHHPHIVRMVETFEDDHHFYIIMELCTAGTMLDRVKEHQKEFSEEWVKEHIGKLASVIQYLHSRFICHRDLKLENILVESQAMGGEIKLCDFGASTLFRMGVCMRKVLGSVVYMAPEVLEGNYTQSCDLWSLGVIMYMLLSNRAPFHGATEDDLIQSIFDANIDFKDPVWTKVSTEAKSLIKKLLNPDATARYTAAQVLAHPWIKSHTHAVPDGVYDMFVPRLKTFGQYSPLQRAALVAVAFSIPSNKIRRHSEVYNELNKAHNGILTLQELQSAPALKRFNLDTEKIYQSLDQQHDKGVNLLEFVAATLSADEITNETHLKTAFRLFDRAHTGKISPEDLLALLGQHFDRLACEEMVRRADVDKDGHIGYQDFTKLMKLPARYARATTVRNLPALSNASPTRISDPGSIAAFSPSRRASVSVRTTSSIMLDIDNAAKSHSPHSVEKRRSSTPRHKIAEAVASIRAESVRQDIAAAEIAQETRAEALIRIQSFSLDLQRAKSIVKLTQDPTDEIDEHGDTDVDTPTSSDTTDLHVEMVPTQ